MKAAYKGELPKELQGQVEGYVYVHTFNFYIKTKIVEVTKYEVIMEQGTLTLEDDITLVKYDRPSNIIAAFKFCYAVFDQYQNLLCWIADPVEKKKGLC